MVGKRPQLKKECAPFDKKCREKLKTTAFFKPKKQTPKGGPPTGPPAGATTATKKVEKSTTTAGRDIAYSVTFPGGETRIKTAPRDPSMTLREQIKELRKRALELRAKKND